MLAYIHIAPIGVIMTIAEQTEVKLVNEVEEGQKTSEKKVRGKIRKINYRGSLFLEAYNQFVEKKTVEARRYEDGRGVVFYLTGKNKDVNVAIIGGWRKNLLTLKNEPILGIALTYNGFSNGYESLIRSMGNTKTPTIEVCTKNGADKKIIDLTDQIYTKIGNLY